MTQRSLGSDISGKFQQLLFDSLNFYGRKQYGFFAVLRIKHAMTQCSELTLIEY